jgi:HAD superfamily hydrolase (TIGR01509 family)
MNQTVVDAFASAECFLWDFDGCFADTERIHFLAYSEAFAHVGHTLSETEYYPSFTHLGDGTGREIAANNLRITEDYILRLKAEAYRRLISLSPVRCFPETPEIVRAMKARGAKVAIASNSSEAEIRAVLNTAGYPFEELDLIVGKNEKLRKKPAPDIFLHALDRLGCSAAKSVVFEDSNRGLMAASAAGCQSVWVRTRYNAGLETSEPHLDSLTHNQILDVFRRPVSAK